MRKLYDCITYLNCPDILKLRLAELGDYIDLFVIVECTHNFRGYPKPIYLSDKSFPGYPIRHIVVEPRWLDTGIRQELAWNNTNGVVEEGFRIGCQDADATDIGFFSDFDEIMRPSKLLDGPLDRPVLFEMELFVYWLNCRAWRKGDSTTRCPFGQIESYWSALMYRYAPEEHKVRIPDAGWHFTSFGGIDVVMEKLAGYPDNPHLVEMPRAEVEDDMLRGRDFSDMGRGKIDRGLGPMPDDLPETILANPKDWTNLMHPDWRDL